MFFRNGKGMHLKTLDITLEDGAVCGSFLEPRQEDRRVMCKNQESEESLPFASLPPLHVARKLSPRTCEPQRDISDSRKSTQMDRPEDASTTMVVAPPIIPTDGKHHVYTNGEEDDSGTVDDTEKMVPPGSDRVQRATTEALVTSSADTQDTTDGDIETFLDVTSATLKDEGTPRHLGQSETHEKGAMHSCPLGTCRFSLPAEVPPLDATREHGKDFINIWHDQALPLYRFEEIPPWQKYNPYIRSHYRAFYTFKMCFKSLLGWHNETINVYTHLLTFVAFLALTALLYTTVLRKAITAPSLRSSKIIYGIFCFGSLICMLNSTLYHLFNSHCSCRVMKAMGRLDFIGITALIVSSFLPPLYVMFHCHPVARTVYITAILLLSTAGIVGPLTDLFHKHVWVRVNVFLGLGFSGLVPALHSLMIVPMNAASASTTLGICLMVVLYCSGVAFYVTQFPESRFPGHFDCLFSSHQLWHFFVSMAALVHYFNCVSMYQLWQVSDGMCG
ncbi:hypothetical protein, conserved [Leishmania tarentolae]|uniref:Adiponectin receptor protein 1 n=1 Tax=Leishmania tarentolae TaxID=5689 RepID=A0A640L1G8_LEITA|nr:hypothetical protein, conserved [Leishmania tarentolae]